MVNPGCRIFSFRTRALSHLIPHPRPQKRNLGRVSGGQPLPSEDLGHEPKQKQPKGCAVSLTPDSAVHGRSSAKPSEGQCSARAPSAATVA